MGEERGYQNMTGMGAEPGAQPPQPDAIPLVQASWRLRVYEVATGRKLMDKRLAGDDRGCPSAVLIYADRKIYATVSDRALVSTLRNLVTR